MGSDSKRLAHPAKRNKARSTRSLTSTWGFPLCLAGAVVTGLPCVLADTPLHRALIEDFRTGFLCVGVDAFLLRIVRLRDAAELRRALGEAARIEARSRLLVRGFREAMRKGYENGDAPQLRNTGP